MRILGIETSCDETAAAVVEDGRKILSNVVASSKELQKKYGGIIPEQAAREQIKAILPVVEESLSLGIREKGIGNRRKNSSLFTAIDAIAVTVGPGLIGSLLVGVETAKTLAYVFKKPIIPVNHLLGHIYASWLVKMGKKHTAHQKDKRHFNNIYHYSETKFPAMCLIVSGGHTLLLLMENHCKFKLLGETRDDAAGEAFDKTARLLGLSYPGGPAIEDASKKGNPKAFNFPRPMIDSEDYDFSFSGLKTAVLREVQKLGIMNQESGIRNKDKIISDLAASIQEAIVDVLVEKTIRAAGDFKVKSIIVGGGVAANKRLREKFSIFNFQFSIFIPPPFLCTDNAAVIATASFFNNKPTPWEKITAKPGLEFP